MSEETQTPKDETAKEAEEVTNTEEEVQTEGAEKAEDTAPVENEPEARIAELEAERNAIKDQLVRTMADMENLRKRTEKQIADSRSYAIEKFAGDLLSVSDNMTRALSAVSDEAKEQLSEQGKSLLAGIEMTQKELHASFARNGVIAIDAAPGASFDPNFHQAISQIPSDQPNGSVAETFQSGWKIGDRTLRAAMVAVSAGGGASTSE
ncbi:nucleotide exchange factor GrpE [Hirschia maritima]|uniref:nucleotide exchange factor GrpE n=1 Tax=Hirschia maritima TaxID=1121961 RepID=UPI00037FC61E|nr:nucleotide exchange factor GrpE [Hirschia maritima]